MARPTVSTPIETVVAVLRSLVGWGASYDDELKLIFGAGHQTEEKAEKLADELEEEQQTFVREQREDVGLTDRRDAVVAETQMLVSSGAALARIAFSEESNVEKIVRDFAAEPPSQIRSPQAARRALTRLQAALEIHEKAMRRKLANVDAFKKRVDDVFTQLNEVAEDDAVEAAETNAAQRRRDETRHEALTFMRNMQLAAEAVEFMQPRALGELHAIFDTHNPKRRPSTQDVELEIAAQAPDAGVDASTPVGGDISADVQAEQEAPEPTEA
jgi:hypothetical protein